MTVREAYLKFTDRINQLSSNHGQHVGGIRQFVDIFNEATLSVMHEILNADEATDSMQEYLSVFFKTEELTGINKGMYYAFKLPADYEHYKQAWGKYSTDTCKGDIHIQLRRAGEASRLYNDAMYSPSIEWEETFATLGKDELRVYVKDFNVEVSLDYYRQPALINMEGYTNADGASVDINPEFDGRFLEIVLDRAARLHLRNTGDARIQLFQ